MTGFSFVDKNNGNVDYIVSWRDSDIIPAGYPVDEKHQVVKIDNYKKDYKNYKTYDFANKKFIK